jgi:hypothetical protein
VEGDLLGTTDLESLPLLHGFDESRPRSLPWFSVEPGDPSFSRAFPAQTTASSGQ